MASVASAATNEPQPVEGLIFDSYCGGAEPGACDFDVPFPECLHGFGCFDYDLWKTEGTIVNVRRRGTPTVIARLTPVEGRFQIDLPPGRYALRAIAPEGTCVFGEVEHLWINPRALASPYYLALQVGQRGTWTNGTCVPYPHP